MHKNRPHKMKFKSGQIVIVSNRNLNYSPDGFVTSSSDKDGGMRLYEKINLETYPSWNDFHGKSTMASDGDIVTICRKVGRPARIRKGQDFLCYDVYEILINGEIRQAFKHNLFPLLKVET